MTILRTLVGWWLIFGGITGGVWLVMECRVIGPKRRHALYPALRWWEYPLAVCALFVCWPAFWRRAFRLAATPTPPEAP